MPRINVTRSWLRLKIADMQRVVRNYADSDTVDAYWTRLTAKVNAKNDAVQDLRLQFERVYSMLSELEVELDAKL